jgi:hypothetical protein
MKVLPMYWFLVPWYLVPGTWYTSMQISIVKLGIVKTFSQGAHQRLALLRYQVQSIITIGVSYR